MDWANTPAVWAVTNATGLGADEWSQQWTAAHRLGFEGLALPIEALEQARPVLAEVGGCIPVVRAAAVGGQYLGSTDPTVRADAVRHFLEQLVLAGRAGAGLVIVNPAGPRMADDPVDEYAEVLQAMHQSLRALVEPVQRAGVQLSIQVGRDGILLSPLEARELIDRVGRPEIGICLDVAAVSRFSCPADWVSALRYRLNCVVVQSCSDMEMRSLCVVLDEVGYTGPIIFSGDQGIAGELMQRLVG